jgi:hypothetical protein
MTRLLSVVLICIVAGNVLPAPAGTATAAPAAPCQPVTTTQSLPDVSDIQMQMAYASLGLPYTGSSSPFLCVYCNTVVKIVECELY